MNRKGRGNKGNRKVKVRGVRAICDLGEGSLIGMVGAGDRRLKRERNHDYRLSFQKYTCAAKDHRMAGRGEIRG